MSIAIVTGGSRGLGRALVAALLARGWDVVTDARDAAALARAATEMAGGAERAGPGGGAESGGGVEPGTLVAVAGDVADARHRRALVAAAQRVGGLDLVVNNAGILGPSPQPFLREYPLEALRQVYEINVVAPLGMVQDALPLLLRSSDPRVLDITSDASVEAYERWGGYGSAKAAVDHLGRVLEVEEPDLRVWTVDPGDMATQMHQEAFPGEDISDRPDPTTVVAPMLTLIESSCPSGRYRVADLAKGARR